MRKATDRHQDVSRDASGGKGVDRHLFALYVVGMGLGKVPRAALTQPKRRRLL
jgi:hypothetical protein